MVKSKHPSHNMFHITVSPKSGEVSVETLEKLLLLITKKDVEKYAYVVEHGKDQNHPHLHLLIKYIKNKRQDTVKTTVVTKAKKHMVVSPYTIVVKTAWNPQYLITQYLQKEGELINEGFDMKQLKDEFKSIKREVYTLDSQQIPITRQSFLRLYRELQTQIKIKYALKYINEHINEFLKLVEAKGYNLSFYFWNKRQCNDIVRYVNDDFIAVENII